MITGGVSPFPTPNSHLNQARLVRKNHSDTSVRCCLPLLSSALLIPPWPVCTKYGGTSLTSRTLTQMACSLVALLVSTVHGRAFVSSRLTRLHANTPQQTSTNRHQHQRQPRSSRNKFPYRAHFPSSPRHIFQLHLMDGRRLGRLSVVNPTLAFHRRFLC